MGPRPYVWFCAYKTTTLGPDIQVCVGPRPNLLFRAQITACLAQEKKVYTCSSPHLWFCAYKTTTLDQNYKSVWDPDLTNRFGKAKPSDLHQNDKFIWVPDLICGFEHT